MGSSSDAYLGWALPLPDTIDEDDIDLDDQIYRGCEFSVPRPETRYGDPDHDRLWKEWSELKDAAVTVGYACYGDLVNGDSGLLLTTGNVLQVYYSYGEVEQKYLNPPGFSNVEKFKRVLALLGEEPRHPKLMLWSCYG